LDSSQWREGTLAVRVHSVTLASGQSIDVLAVIDGHTAEDPATGFYSSPSATVTLNSSSSAPSFHLQLLDDQPIGGLVSIVVGGTQGGSATSFSATLSVDLVLKD
ncbi:MAG: hypothetical protein K8H88_23385, partial [Sandaracinaceae bacterium]|nr:hypothetical protein [Sandaracinaceae bacterium]